MTGALGSFVDSLYAEPLIVMGWDGRPQPGLAVAWAWGDGGRTLRLRLRKGVVFHDGSPLTAQTVAGILERRRRNVGFQRVSSIDVEGDDVVVLRLARPDSFLLGELSTGNVRTGQNQTLGTGPFVLRSQKPEVVLDAFPKYHLGTPSISKVIIRTYETQRAAWAATLRGEVEFLYEVNRDAVGFVEAESRLRTFSFLRGYYVPIVFNVKHPILGRREVRQAINEAIDRKAVVDIALNGRGQPADGPIWPYHWAYNSGGLAYTYNPEAARVRLDAGGLRLAGPRNGQTPGRFRFRCLFWSEDAQFERIALVVQKQLFEVGVDVEMLPMTIMDIQTRLRTGDFEAILVPMTSSRSLEWTYWFWRSVPPDADAYTRSGYTAADAVLDRMREAQSDEDTRMAVSDLQRILYEDPPAAFLVRLEGARAVADSFLVPDEGQRRDVLGTLWLWKPRALPATQLAE